MGKSPPFLGPQIQKDTMQVIDKQPIELRRGGHLLDGFDGNRPAVHGCEKQ